ncbi:MAG TPA: hypothetical protein VLG66_02580, partial [Alphaproteobacteria bacterium]|nr:hypothetical protein [Alphaproteobacteria bacterium]
MITVRDDPNITSAVTLARHYYYIDDAIQDAMRLVAALAQSGARAQLPDAAAVIVSQKRRLGTDRWGAGDEAAFWAAFAELATVAKEHGLLRRPSPRISRSGRSWWRLKRIAAYRALLIIFVIVL